MEVISSFAQAEELLKVPCAPFHLCCAGDVFTCSADLTGAYWHCETDRRKSRFDLHLPKIPYKLYKGIGKFFLYIYKIYDTEAAVRLFWDKENEEYILYVPEQVVTHTTVSFNRDSEFDQSPMYKYVGDIHSHGRIQAFWSSTDNADEVNASLNGVYGGYGSNFNIKFRAAWNGWFFDIPIEDVLDSAEDRLAAGEVFDELTDQIDEKITFL